MPKSVIWVFQMVHIMFQELLKNCSLWFVQLFALKDAIHYFWILSTRIYFSCFLKFVFTVRLCNFCSSSCSHFSQILSDFSPFFSKLFRLFPHFSLNFSDFFPFFSRLVRLFSFFSNLVWIDYLTSYLYLFLLFILRYLYLFLLIHDF